MEVLGLPARRLGNGLIGFGVAGLVVTAIMAIGWVVGLLAISDLDERLEADRQATVTALDEAASLLDSTAAALENSTSTMGGVSSALEDTARILDQLATTTADLADSLDVTILGQQPFAGLSASFDDIAGELETFAGHAGSLAAEVDQLEPDLAAIAADLRAVESSVSALASRVDAFEGVEELVGLIRGYVLLSALLAAWLAVLAAGCIWAGRQLRQASVIATAETTPTS